MSQKIRTLENPQYHEYIIIGAGISGLHAAEILAQNQEDFLILQASNKIGGRISTDYLGQIIESEKISYKWLQNEQVKKVPVQIGATWISVQHTYMTHIIKQLKLRLFPQYCDGLTIYGIDYGNYSRIESLSQHYKRHSTKLNKLIDIIDNLTQTLQSFSNQKNQRQQFIKYYDEKKLSQFIDQQLQDNQLAQMVKKQIQTLQCITCQKVSVLQIIQDAGGSLQLLRLYSQKIQDSIDGMKIKQGSQAIINRMRDHINNILSQQYDTQINKFQRNNGFIKLGEPIVKITNQLTKQVLIKTRNNNYYSCRKVLLSVPIAVVHKIQITKISPSKKLIFDNQQFGKVTRKYFIFKQAFWRSKYTGYGSFSKKFPFNQITDLSPSNLSCGILAFVFIGQTYQNLIENFRKQQNPKQYQKQYFLKILVDMFIGIQIKSQILQQCITFSKTFTYNQFIQAAYQSTTKPKIWQQIVSNGDDYIQSYSRDQYDIIYIGSQYADQYSTYMQGAIRLTRQKIFKLLGKKDPWKRLLK